jgi:hypothetical protein
MCHQAGDVFGNIGTNESTMCCSVCYFHQIVEVIQSYFHQNTIHCIKYMTIRTKVESTVKAIKETLQQSPNAICEDLVVNYMERVT